MASEADRSSIALVCDGEECVCFVLRYRDFAGSCALRATSYESEARDAATCTGHLSLRAFTHTTAHFLRSLILTCAEDLDLLLKRRTESDDPITRNTRKIKWASRSLPDDQRDLRQTSFFISASFPARRHRPFLQTAPVPQVHVDKVVYSQGSSTRQCMLCRRGTLLLQLETCFLT
jgi:hypothetical protein